MSTRQHLYNLTPLPQNELKAEIKNWMKQPGGLDRYQLASWCGVTKRTIDNWLSTRKPIPHSKAQILQIVMHISGLLRQPS